MAEKVVRRTAKCALVNHALAGIATIIGITIIIIVAVHLDKTTTVVNADGTAGKTYDCLLSGSGAQSTCNYAYVVVAFSFVATIFIHLIQWSTSKIFQCGLGAKWADTMLAIFLCLWWSVACGVISVGIGNAAGKGLPESNWRNATLSLFWVEFLLFLLIAVAGAFRNGMKGMVGETVVVSTPAATVPTPAAAV